MARPKKDTATKIDKTTDATTADVKTTVEVVEAQDVITTVVENSVETVEETKEVPVADISEVPAEDATKKPKTKTKRNTKAKTPKKAPKETKKKVAINGVVPLSGPTTIYRGPGVYPFAKINGVVKPLGDADETGYTKVQCVISGFGACTGYVKL